MVWPPANPDAGHGAGDGQGGEDFPSTMWAHVDSTGVMQEPKWDDSVPPVLMAMREPAGTERLEMTISLKAPREKAELLAARLREDLAALGPGATVTVVPDDAPKPTGQAPFPLATLTECLAAMSDAQRAEVRAEMDAAMPEIARQLNEPGPLARLLTPEPLAPQTVPLTPGQQALLTHLRELDTPERHGGGFQAVQILAERAGAPVREGNDDPRAVQRWQEHIRSAWARAINLAGMMNSNTPTLAVPTVTELQDATAKALAREHTRGVGVIHRMWMGALNLGRVRPASLEELIEQTAELVDREREQQHVIAGLHQQVDAHRSTIAKLTGPTTPDGETLEALVRTYFAEKALWRAKKSPDDAPHYDAMDAALDAMEALITPPVPVATEERDDDIPF
jgi:hypothetical protein